MAWSRGDTFSDEYGYGDPPPATEAPGAIGLPGLGLPNTYPTHDEQGNPIAYGVQYQYPPGYEWTPYNDQASIPALQGALLRVGLLDPDEATPNMWLPAEAGAYRALLGIANGWGVDAQTALGSLLANPALAAKVSEAANARRKSKRGAPAQRVQLTSADDLAAVANEVAPQVLGRRLNDDELRRFVSGYHGAERGRSAATPSTAAEVFATETAPTEAAVRDLSDVYHSFLSIISGGG